VARSVSNIYYEPEKFGLTILKSHDIAGSYQFDMIVVWRTDDGRFLVGQDSGCSCPSPFEDTGVRDLKEVESQADVADFARSRWGDSYYSWEGRTVEDDITALLDGLVLQ
jgi:hypothetical protein